MTRNPSPKLVLTQPHSTTILAIDRSPAAQRYRAHVTSAPITGPAAMSAREALEIATLGGARVLNRDDIGALAPGMSADFVSFDRHQVGLAGADHDPVAALVFCAPSNVAHSVINGRVVVEDGRLTTLELDAHLTIHRRLALELAQAARAVPA
mgnify:CR=1 FL=1